MAGATAGSNTTGAVGGISDPAAGTPNSVQVHACLAWRPTAAGPRTRPKCLANEIFGVASADPLGQIPVYLPCMSFEQGREGVRIGKGGGYLLSVGRLSLVTLVSVPHLTESCPLAGIRFPSVQTHPIVDLSGPARVGAEASTGPPDGESDLG